MAEQDKPRRFSRGRGARSSGPALRDPRLSELSHEMASHVLTMRLLLGNLSSSASAGQHEVLRMLGEVLEAQSGLARELGGLSRSVPEEPGIGGPERG